MLEQAKNIIIKGDSFKEKTTFELFSQRSNLLFGKRLALLISVC